ncbi:MAG: exodeoxyribonuclease V subunit gamma [Ilumatobacteraceae bacterium]
MTFVLHRAERADVLTDVLAGLLATPVADPFSAEVVAVHSLGVERWLAHQLSARLGATAGRADGVCANLRFPFPGRMVQSALAAATGVDPGADPWRPERLAWSLLDVVEANLEEDWLYVLGGHLGAGDVDDARRDRRFAVVRHLADLYDRYAVHRPSMVLAWAAGDDHDGEGAELPADARWQAELWRRLRHAIDVPSPAERAVTGCVALAADPSLVALPDRLFLFGLTRLPASYLDVLRALAEHRDVHLLALHPSPAAWGLDDQDALRHPLLRAWGRDSHEMQVVLNRRLRTAPAAADLHHALPDRVQPTLLHRLQDAIRSDTPPPDDDERAPLRPGDASVQVHACHGRARQAEVACDAITHLLAADPTLEPRDIVVLCPDIDEYAPLLRAAFDDAAADDDRTIPYRLADRSLRQTNPVLGALAELLGLVDARLTASQVLAFAALPPVRQRFGFDDDDLARIGEWVEATGTRWGLDGPHRTPYDLAGVATGTWDAGLQRLLLGIAMTEDDHRTVGGVLPLDDVDSGTIDLAGRFAELIGRLGAVVGDLGPPRPVAAWVNAIDTAADLLFATRADDAWQRAQLDRLLVDVQDEAGHSAAPALRLAELRDLLADRLRGQPTRAAFRTGDLTMCTLVPMRSVPHRVVCIVGLDDGVFPRGGAPDGDDLLLRARHIGDHDRRAEDRQLLLDALLAAGDTLVVTYSGRDARTNEVLPPAVPVHELLDSVDATVRTVDGRRASEAITRHHPLQPADRRCFVPGALGTDGPWGFDPQLLAGAIAASGPRRSPPPFLDQPLPAVPEPFVALDDLVALLHHPVRGFLRQRLGIRLRTDAELPGNAMVIDLDGLSSWGVGQRLLSALLAGGDPDAVCAAELARGLLPPGELGRRALATARARADAIAGRARAAADGPRRSLEVDVALPDGRHLVGAVPDVVGTTLRTATFSKLGPKPRLRAWVNLLAATASHPGRSLSSTTIGRDGNRAATFVLPALDRDTALAHLTDLVTLRDEALRGPIPVYCETSYRYAGAARDGVADPVAAAATSWTTEYGYRREDLDAEHVLVLGGQQPIDDVVADGRFDVLARRLWDPILEAAGRS